MSVLDNIRVVLVGPLYGGNVGSVCRAMANMGLSDLALVDPRRLDMQEARMMACHATEILEGRKECPTLADAAADCHAVAGATARRGLYRQQARTPREWAPRLIEIAHQGRVALVFGREDDGLNNEELALCTHLVQIPSSPTYVSLNLAQAAMLCCYEIFLASDTYVPPEEKSAPASVALRERMFGLWRETLLQIGFMKEDKSEHMMLGLRRVFARGAFTEDDVRILMGVARQAEWASGEGCSHASERQGDSHV